MRHYSIETTNGLTTFKCPLCKHSVTTQEFSSQNGSRRTQAAKVMNEHASVAHGVFMLAVSHDAQIRHAH
jgi:hypothetical protein